MDFEQAICPSSRALFGNWERGSFVGMLNWDCCRNVKPRNTGKFANGAERKASLATSGSSLITPGNPFVANSRFLQVR